MAEYNILGVDIGGTKCAVIYGRESDGELTIVEKVKFPTTRVDETIARIVAETESLMSRHGPKIPHRSESVVAVRSTVEPEWSCHRRICRAGTGFQL